MDKTKREHQAGRVRKWGGSGRTREGANMIKNTVQNSQRANKMRDCQVFL